ncbi:glycoside hydrolase domain-containing protein [Neobacillus ginsengisoli]|uniref:Sucrose-6-phosphate hydrolase SacC (GH32 family) n=1 Tax=Neobacillus ginsengisoli TaxID=904295 RepID=A0ABT9XWC2_9BACI|nr:sucrose-6-phosphate hydrolase SacC (GH32 family) [Neobacillus ginsengisoli]
MNLLTVEIKIPKYRKIDLKILTDYSVVVFYVNDIVAFSTRMFNMKKHQWGIFSVNSDISYHDMKISI